MASTSSLKPMTTTTCYNKLNKIIPSYFSLVPKKLSFSIKYSPFISLKSSYSSSFIRYFTMGDVTTVDANMDAVQRKLMFDDELVFIYKVLIFFLFS